MSFGWINMFAGPGPRMSCWALLNPCSSHFLYIILTEKDLSRTMRNCKLMDKDTDKDFYVSNFSSFFLEVP